MRKITKESVQAFVNAIPFSKSNVTVQVLPNVTIYLLFGNAIAYRYNDPERTLLIDNCGHKTNTTKDRLNGILQALKLGAVYQKNKEWYVYDYFGKEVINKWAGRTYEFKNSVI